MSKCSHFRTRSCVGVTSDWLGTSSQEFGTNPNCHRSFFGAYPTTLGRILGLLQNQPSATQDQPDLALSSISSNEEVDEEIIEQEHLLSVCSAL